jgi:hypothetical protein
MLFFGGQRYETVHGIFTLFEVGKLVYRRTCKIIRLSDITENYPKKQSSRTLIPKAFGIRFIKYWHII